jgi:hypothetical protein
MTFKLFLSLFLVSTALGQTATESAIGTESGVGTESSIGGGTISGTGGGLPVGPACGDVYSLAFRDSAEYVLNLTKAINFAATEAELYQNLVDLAPCPKWELLLLAAVEDSMKHFDTFSELHTCIVGSEHTPTVRNFTFSTFQQGLEIAFFFDSTAIDLYKELYVGTSVPSIQRAVFGPLIGKQQHQKLLSWIFFSLNMPNMNCDNVQDILDYQFATDVAASVSFGFTGTEGGVGSQGGVGSGGGSESLAESGTATESGVGGSV